MRNLEHIHARSNINAGQKKIFRSIGVYDRTREAEKNAQRLPAHVPDQAKHLSYSPQWLSSSSYRQISHPIYPAKRKYNVGNSYLQLRSGTEIGNIACGNGRQGKEAKVALTKASKPEPS